MGDDAAPKTTGGIGMMLLNVFLLTFVTDLTIFLKFRPQSFYRFANGFRHLIATFNDKRGKGAHVSPPPPPNRHFDLSVFHHRNVNRLHALKEMGFLQHVFFNQE